MGFLHNAYSDKTRGIYLAQDPAVSQAIYPANEDWTVMVEVIEAGGEIVAGSKIWDLAASKRVLYARRIGSGYPAVGSVVLFHRCGDFAGNGAGGFELHTPDPTKTSWLCFNSVPVLEIYDIGNGTGYPVLFTGPNSFSANGPTLEIAGGSVGAGRMLAGQLLGGKYRVWRGEIANTQKTWETELLIGNSSYKFALDTDAAGKVVDMSCQVTPAVFVDDPRYRAFGFSAVDDAVTEDSYYNVSTNVFLDPGTNKYYWRAKAAQSASYDWHTPTAAKWLWQAYSDAAGQQLYLQIESDYFASQGTNSNWVWFEATRNLTANKRRLIGQTDPYQVAPNSGVIGDIVLPTTYVRVVEFSGNIMRRSPLFNCLAYISWQSGLSFDGYYDPATDSAQPWGSEPAKPEEAYPCYYWSATEYKSGNDDLQECFLYMIALSGANYEIPKPIGNGVSGRVYIDKCYYRGNSSVSRYGIYYASRAATNIFFYSTSPAGWFSFRDLGMKSMSYSLYSLYNFWVCDKWITSRFSNQAGTPAGGSYYTLDYVSP